MFCVAESFTQMKFFVPAKRQVTKNENKTDACRQHPMEGELVSDRIHQPIGNRVDAVAGRKIDNQKGGHRDFKPIELSTGNIVMGSLFVLRQSDLFAQGFRHLMDCSLEVYDLGQTSNAVYQKIKAQRGQEDLSKSKSHR